MPCHLNVVSLMVLISYSLSFYKLFKVDFGCDRYWISSALSISSNVIPSLGFGFPQHYQYAILFFNRCPREDCKSKINKTTEPSLGDTRFNSVRPHLPASPNNFSVLFIANQKGWYCLHGIVPAMGFVEFSTFFYLFCTHDDNRYKELLTFCCFLPDFRAVCVCFAHLGNISLSASKWNEVGFVLPSQKCITDNIFFIFRGWKTDESGLFCWTGCLIL